MKPRFTKALPLFAATLLLATLSSGWAGVPPLVQVPDYLPPDVKQKLDAQRDDLENRIAALRNQAADFNASYGNRTFAQDDPQAKTGLEQKAKLDQAGQDYSRDAQAFDEQVSTITDSMVVDARNVPTGLPKDIEDSIPHTPAGDRVRKGFEAIADPDWKRHDWKVALAWFQDALNHEPDNAGIKRLVDFAQYTVNRRTADHTLAFENNSAPAQPAASPPANGDQPNPELKVDMEEFFKVVIEPRVKANDESLLVNTETSGQPQMTESKAEMEEFYKEVIEPRIKAGDAAESSGQSQTTGDSSWSKFIKWMNDNFAPKKTKEPQPVAAVRD